MIDFNTGTRAQLFLDCDGVLADFDAAFISHFGHAPRDYEDRNGSEVFWRDIRHEVTEFYRNLPLMRDARELFDAVRHLRPIILTGCPMGGWAEAQKQAWAAEHFPGTPMITCMSRDKRLFCRKGDILIDDLLRYRDRWEGAGGIFIHHTSARESIDAIAALEPSPAPAVAARTILAEIDRVVTAIGSDSRDTVNWMIVQVREALAIMHSDMGIPTSTEPTPVELLVSREWLRQKIEADPDVENDAGRAIPAAADDFNAGVRAAIAYHRQQRDRITRDIEADSTALTGVRMGARAAGHDADADALATLLRPVPALPSPAAELAQRDALIHGIGVMCGGKRISPAEFFRPDTEGGDDFNAGALTPKQKMEALSYRFYQGGTWQPKAGDYYTTSRADLELYQVVAVADGKVRTRYTDGRTDAIAEWDEAGFLTEGFGLRRVYVPEWCLRPEPALEPVKVSSALDELGQAFDRIVGSLRIQSVSMKRDIAMVGAAVAVIRQVAVPTCAAQASAAPERL